jgi:hypothetical protein
MAYNIIAESTQKLDYVKVHKDIKDYLGYIEAFPMPGLGKNDGDALGICTPLKNANEDTWNDLKKIMKKLKSNHNCDIYDLYGGQKLNIFNFQTFKKNLLL